MSLCKKLLIGILAATMGSACATTQAIRNLMPVIRHAESRKNIEKIILENAKINQTIMFGEDHISRSDNRYTISLLPKLKQLGYKNICLEIDSHEQQLVDDYVNEKVGKSELLRNVRYYNPNFDILKSAKKLGYKIHCIDERPKEFISSEFGTERSYKKYENMKKRIFDKNPNAKVVIFIGAAHINESKILHYYTDKDEIMLGQILEEKLKGNYSINLLKSNVGRDTMTKVDLDNNGNLDFIRTKDYFIKYQLNKLIKPARLKPSTLKTTL